ncbi:MAG: thioredoxin domain-containing protein, partial [Candidatus Aminicenantes bacterium]|nr:thioredoxin domain-containing protein [Candidatus Aminicenantes bacterium]
MAQNRLSQEKSPYLRQHASNPVDWYPWGDEAFVKAEKENKPVFVSIGYSTCHWCHVMEHESFEDEAVAALMNDIFVSIKVDREERPDVDNVYMKVCQMMTGRGGWPLTIIMTPDKKPFFAGTYIPQRGRFNQIGMLELIPKIGELWKKSRTDLSDSADKIIQALGKQPSPAGSGQIREETLHSAYRQLAQSFDSRNGGFGLAPKFPAPHTLLFLLRYWRRENIPFALEMVEKTLQAMRSGGIFDHVGYGFHRYSTDSLWRLPHFEKMLYDQALLAMTYTEAYQATKKTAYRKNADEIFTYVLRDLSAPEGGFYCAEDADSEGEEGKYYTWTWNELSKELRTEELDLAAKLFHLEKEGNFVDEATGERNGSNVLFRTLSLDEFVAEEEGDAVILTKKIKRLLRKLNDLRNNRVRPLRDIKILTDWNGLMIAALAKAAQAFSRPDLTAAAVRAVRFILRQLRSKDGGLLHSHCEGESKTAGFADDYAFFVWGLIELYEATFEESFLQTALEMNQFFIRRFWDDRRGGIYFTSNAEKPLFIRTKESF